MRESSGLDIRSYAAKQGKQVGLGRITEIAVRVVDVLESFQQGIVVEVRIRDGARLEGRGEQDRASAVTAVISGYERIGTDGGGLWEGGEIRARLLVTAVLTLKRDGDGAAGIRQRAYTHPRQN